MTLPDLLNGLDRQGQAWQWLRNLEVVLAPAPCHGIFPLHAGGAAVPGISLPRQCHGKTRLVPRATDPLGAQRLACPLLTPQGSQALG